MWLVGAQRLQDWPIMVLDSAKKQARARRTGTTSEALFRQEFQALFLECRKAKQDPVRQRESLEMKSRLIALDHAIRSPMVIPKLQSTRRRKPQWTQQQLQGQGGC